MKTRSEEILEALIDLSNQNAPDKVLIKFRKNTDGNVNQYSEPRCTNNVTITSTDLRDFIYDLAIDLHLSRKAIEQLGLKS